MIDNNCLGYLHKLRISTLNNININKFELFDQIEAQIISNKSLLNYTIDKTIFNNVIENNKLFEKIKLKYDEMKDYFLEIYNYLINTLNNKDICTSNNNYLYKKENKNNNDNMYYKLKLKEMENNIDKKSKYILRLENSHIKELQDLEAYYKNLLLKKEKIINTNKSNCSHNKELELQNDIYLKYNMNNLKKIRKNNNQIEELTKKYEENITKYNEEFKSKENELSQQLSTIELNNKKLQCKIKQMRETNNTLLIENENLLNNEIEYLNLIKKLKNKIMKYQDNIDILKLANTNSNKFELQLIK